MSTNKNKLNIGKYGENYVCKYLKKNNCDIICTNYHSKYGEIDIICENIKYILFVEVKTRKFNSMCRGIYSVDLLKQDKIIKTYYDYISKFEINKQPRFDIAEVILDYNNIVCKLNYYKNCFGAEEISEFF